MIPRGTTILVIALGIMHLASTECVAGAWTLTKHHWQIFSDATVSQGNTLLGVQGPASLRTKFSKALLQSRLEYGLTDRVTLFATSAFAIANAQTAPDKPINVRDTSVEAGARILLLKEIGMLSIQSSYKSAGAFDLNVSADHRPGRQIDFRVLYGTNFSLFDMRGFTDVQIGQRWNNRPRPNETPLDFTAGLWITSRTMLMAQSLNVISAGDAIEPYSYYRIHKFELSVVQKVTRLWSLRVGAFASPAGQNVLDERGVSVSIWTQS